MNTIEILCVATGLGVGAGVFTGAGVYLRLVARLRAKEARQAVASDLEKRRETYLSGRDQEPRENAGVPATSNSLFPIKRLGSLAQRKRGEGI